MKISYFAPLLILFPVQALANDFWDAAYEPQEDSAFSELYSWEQNEGIEQSSDTSFSQSIYDGLKVQIEPLLTIREIDRYTSSLLKDVIGKSLDDADRKLLQLIAGLEAPKNGYDGVWAKNKVALPSELSKMTICEVQQWQSVASIKQDSSAAGMYQIIRTTLKHLVGVTELACNTMFDGETQDKFAIVLANEAGWSDFKAGILSLDDFAHQLAGVWAAFPTPKGAMRGKSRYHGIAGNRALVGLSEYMEALKAIRQG